jgi:hypothetical protein
VTSTKIVKDALETIKAMILAKISEHKMKLKRE